jgi:hypothetical protein
MLPSHMCMQGIVNAAGTDPNWDLLNYPYTSCVSYKKDLSPLQYGDKVSCLPSDSPRTFPCKAMLFALSYIWPGEWTSSSRWACMMQIQGLDKASCIKLLPEFCVCAQQSSATN